MNFRIRRQKIKILSKIKYLGLFLGENLSFKYHLDTINLKLNRANCLLSKIRRYVRAPSLRTIYFAILIRISVMDVKSGDRIKIILLKTLTNNKTKQ